MLKDAQAGKFDVVMSWSLDRLGRSLVDLLHTVEHLREVGVDLYLSSDWSRRSPTWAPRSRYRCCFVCASGVGVKPSRCSKSAASCLSLAAGLPASVASQGDQAKEESDVAKPSIVFVHGIWADGSSFQKLIPTLRAEGHEVIASQYGPDSLKGDVDAGIRSFAGDLSPEEQGVV